MQNKKAVDPVTAGLQRILQQNTDRRVVVVGTTCTGKSTLLAKIPETLDMDALIFPQLTPEETAYVCQTPWTEEIGETMTRLVQERVRVEPGRPVFGTVVIESDLVVVLTISDELLRARVQSRGVDFQDAQNMHLQLLEEVRASGIPFLEYSVG